MSIFNLWDSLPNQKIALSLKEKFGKWLNGNRGAFTREQEADLMKTQEGTLRLRSIVKLMQLPGFYFNDTSQSRNVVETNLLEMLIDAKVLYVIRLSNSQPGNVVFTVFCADALFMTPDGSERSSFYHDLFEFEINDEEKDIIKYKDRVYDTIDDMLKARLPAFNALPFDLKTNQEILKQMNSYYSFIKL